MHPSYVGGSLKREMTFLTYGRIAMQPSNERVWGQTAVISLALFVVAELLHLLPIPEDHLWLHAIEWVFFITLIVSLWQWSWWRRQRIKAEIAARAQAEAQRRIPKSNSL